MSGRCFAPINFPACLDSAAAPFKNALAPSQHHHGLVIAGIIGIALAAMVCAEAVLQFFAGRTLGRGYYHDGRF